ncbi:hypothetical protein J6590_080473 [Homalodisca vitripennis]|nr:hypothetical protein J6590_080473 [Homalodisca vitripennis]
MAVHLFDLTIFSTYLTVIFQPFLSSEHNSNNSLRLKIFFLQLCQQLSSFFSPSFATKEGMFNIIPI